MFCRVIPRFVNVPKCNSIISILSVRSISRCVESLVVALLVSLCPRKEVSQNIYLSNSLRESETSTDNDMSATQFCSLSNLLHLSCCIQRPSGLVIDKKTRLTFCPQSVLPCYSICNIGVNSVYIVCPAGQIIKHPSSLLSFMVKYLEI